MDRVFRFEAQVIETVPSFETFPIVDDARRLIGSFIRLAGDTVRGWVAGNDSPVALRVSTGDDFWFTPVKDEEGIIAYAIVSEAKVGLTSIHVSMAQEEYLPIAPEAQLERKN